MVTVFTLFDKFSPVSVPFSVNLTHFENKKYQVFDASRQLWQAGTQDRAFHAITIFFLNSIKMYLMGHMTVLDVC